MKETSREKSWTLYHLPPVWAWAVSEIICKIGTIKYLPCWNDVKIKREIHVNWLRIVVGIQ